jgi:hypothetical protein
MTERTLYNWMMDDKISWESYNYAISSGKISESDAKTKLITKSEMIEWASINLDNDNELDIII